MKERIGQNITVIIAARNESERLPLVLQNLSCMENVLIADNFSTDSTPQIASDFGRTSIQIKNEGGFCETEEWLSSVLKYVKTEYILLAACAEYIPLKLLKLYHDISTTKIYDIVKTFRRSITAGAEIPIDLPPKILSRFASRQIRFFRIGALSYKNNIVHGTGTITCNDERVFHTPYDKALMFIQYRDYDSSESEEKHRIYNDTIFETCNNKIPELVIPRYIARAIKRFLIRYFLFGCILHGYLGFIHAYYRFHMELTMGFRLYEIQNRLRKKDIRKLHIETRKQLNDKNT